MSAGYFLISFKKEIEMIASAGYAAKLEGVPGRKRARWTNAAAVVPAGVDAKSSGKPHRY